MKKILITGASGFIGQNLIKKSLKLNYLVCGMTRKPLDFGNYSNLKFFFIDNINSKEKLNEALQGIDCIIHCAGKTNSSCKVDSLNLVNVEFTKNLAESAFNVGVKRFIFLSSIKVNGESTTKDNKIKIFNYKDEPNPQDSYAISKKEAEKLLQDIALKTGLEVVIVRLPLVYGSGVKGNLKRLIKLIKLRIPLPFKKIKNKRSLIGIDNVIDLLIRCIEHPNAVGKTFLASDGKDLSTPELMKLIASAMGQSIKFFSFPIGLLKFLGFIFRKQNEIERLTGSLQIDISNTKTTLNWTPSLSVEEGIRRMIEGK